LDQFRYTLNFHFGAKVHKYPSVDPYSRYIMSCVEVLVLQFSTWNLQCKHVEVHTYIHIDDLIVIARDHGIINKLMVDLKSNFIFRDEGNFETFLGVSVKHVEDNSIALTQPQLIRKLLKLVDLGEVNPKPTPAVEVLSKDIDGEERKYQWNYRQAVGILEYLKITTRPDITFAVSQIARFSNNPKRSHEQVLIRIARYLKGTSDKGLFINPKTDSFLEYYCDADFCGLWKVTNPEDPKSVHSRTGFVIFYAGVPLFWCSKLQTQIALSTVEAEYLALSHSAREIIPTQELLQEISKSFNFHIPCQTQIHCDIYEDNNGALELATTPKMRPRTKHIAVCYHYFRSKVQDGSLRVHAIDTKEQVAEIFTKPLIHSKYVYLRKKMMGW